MVLHASAASLHVVVHAKASAEHGAEPATHAPPEQDSTPLQNVPSAHELVLSLVQAVWLVAGVHSWH